MHQLNKTNTIKKNKNLQLSVNMEMKLCECGLKHKPDLNSFEKLFRPEGFRNPLKLRTGQH